MLSTFCGTFFHLLLREVDFFKFSTIFRKNIHFHFPVRIFTALPVSPDIRARLYVEARGKMGVLPVHYYLERINRILAFVIPFLPTHRKDKFK